MKKLRSVFTIALSIALLAAISCAPLFTKVTVKGSTSLYAPLGNTRFSMSDYLSATTIAETLGGMMGFQAFEYRDPAAPTSLKMMLRYPIADVSIDFNDYLESIDFISTIGQTLPRQEFAVPAINLSSVESFNLSLVSGILDQLNASYAPIPIIMPESSTETSIGYPAIPEVDLTCDAFDSLTLSSGSFDFIFAMSAASPGVQLNLTSIGLYDGLGAEISVSGPIDLDVSQPGASVSLPLAGAILPTTSHLRFSFRTSGGSDGSSYTLNVTPSMSSDIGISAGAGIDFSWDLAIPDVVVPLGLDSSFSSALIGAGALDFTIPALGPDYQNFSSSLDLSIIQPGGLNLSVTGSTTPTTSFDLAGQTIVAADITASGTYHVQGVNASFSNYPAGGLVIDLSTEASVTAFTSLAIIPGTPLDLSQSFSQAIDDSITQWVDSIYFTTVGVSVSLLNGLPAGNDISLDVDSTLFGISGTDIYTGGATVAQETDFVSTAYTLPMGAATTVDFTVASSLSGYDTGTGILTLSSVIPGDTYVIEGAVTPIVDWESITLSASAATTAGTFPETGGLDLSILGQYLGEGVGFASIPAYLYLSGFDSLSADMRLQASYTEAEIPVTSYLVGSATDLQTVTAVVPPSFTLNEDGAYAGLIPTASHEIANLEDIFNARPLDLALSYEFSMGSMVINAADVDAGASLRAELLLVLPFALQVIDPAGSPIILDSFLGDFLSQDLFQRTPDGDNSTIDMLLDTLSSVDLTLDIVNDTGLSLQAALVHGTDIDIPIDLSLPSQTITIDGDDFQFIKDTIPFIPTISVVIPPGTWTMRNDASIQVGLSVTAVADFEQTFELDGEGN